MRWRGMMTGLFLFVPALSGNAQTVRDAPASEPYVPRLGDIMSAAQSRHMKLWFAGKLLNWPLADYELRQIKASLEDAATLYPGIPVSDVTTMAEPVRSIAAAPRPGTAANSRRLSAN